MALNESTINIKNNLNKIKTVVEGFKQEVLEVKIMGILECLKTRRSLLQLLVLKLILLRLGKTESLQIINKHKGFSILENSASSTNPDFLDILIEIIIFLGEVRPLSINLLSKFELIHKSLFFEYLNNTCGLFALFEENGTSTYIAQLMNYFHLMPSIKDELNFLGNLAQYPDYEKHKVNLLTLKDKFAQQSTYVTLLKKLDPIAAEQELQSKRAGNIEKEKIKNTTPISNEIVKDLAEKVESMEVSKSSTPRQNLTDSSLPNQSISISPSIENLTKLLEEIISYVEAIEKENNIKIDLSKFKTQIYDKTKFTVEPINKVLISNKTQDVYSKSTVVQEDNDGIETKATNISIKKVQISRPITKPRPPPIGRSLKKPKVKSKLETDKVYIGINWNKTAKGNNSVFSKIDVAALEQEFELEDFVKFEKSKIVRKPIGNEVSFDHKLHQPLDSKKSLALNVALARLKESPAEILEKILKKEIKDENLAKQLILYAPSPEEHMLILKVKDETKLGKAEKLLKKVEDLQSYLTALNKIRFKALFYVKPYKKQISYHISVYSKLLNSKMIVKFFGTLLILGNQLNSNSGLGKAQAFEMESLDKFKTEKISHFMRKKFAFNKLYAEIGNIYLKSSTTGLIVEFQDVRAAYIKEGDGNKEFEEANELYDKLIKITRDTRLFFGVEDESIFINELHFLFIYFNNEK